MILMHYLSYLMLCNIVPFSYFLQLLPFHIMANLFLHLCLDMIGLNDKTDQREHMCRIFRRHCAVMYGLKNCTQFLPNVRCQRLPAQKIAGLAAHAILRQIALNTEKMPSIPLDISRRHWKLNAAAGDILLNFKWCAVLPFRLFQKLLGQLRKCLFHRFHLLSLLVSVARNRLNSKRVKTVICEIPTA